VTVEYDEFRDIREELDDLLVGCTLEEAMEEIIMRREDDISCEADVERLVRIVMHIVQCR